MTTLRNSYLKLLIGITVVLILLIMFYSMRGGLHPQVTTSHRVVTDPRRKEVTNMLDEMNSRISKIYSILVSKSRNHFDVLRGANSVINMHRNSTSRIVSTTSRHHVVGTTSNCLSTIAALVKTGKARLSDSSVFGLDAECLSKLSGKTLRKISNSEALNYGDVSLQSFDEPHCFKRSLTETEKRLYYQPKMAEFQDLLENAGFPFFMDSGTLIGSLRHLGMPPWDDDIDIFVELKHRDNLVKLLKEHQKINDSKTWEFSFTAQPDKHIKFRVQRPYYAHTEDKTFRFCFDMFFYERDLVKKTVTFKQLGGDPLTMPEEVVFPTIRRPFENLWFPAPRRSIKFLNLRYEGAWGTNVKSGSVLNTCVYSTWSNGKSRSFCKHNEVPCSKMKSHYSFVHRILLTKSKTGPALELDLFKDVVLRAAYLPNPAL